jgi:hypothetical protein
LGVRIPIFLGGIVKITRRAINPDGTKVELRKSQRFPVAIPVEVIWTAGGGRTVTQEAVAKQVNSHGGFLEMPVFPDLGTRVTLTNFLSAQTVEARVLATPDTRSGVSVGMIVELMSPSETFWGVDLQVKKTALELHKLEESLRSQGIDLRLLKEFRDAVDYVRTAATVAHQLRELQLNGHDETVILGRMAGERVCRAANLCLSIITDLDDRRISAATPGIAELQDSLEQACARLRSVLYPRESTRTVSSRRS